MDTTFYTKILILLLPSLALADFSFEASLFRADKAVNSSDVFKESLPNTIIPKIDSNITVKDDIVNYNAKENSGSLLIADNEKNIKLDRGKGSKFANSKKHGDRRKEKLIAAFRKAVKKVDPFEANRRRKKVMAGSTALAKHSSLPPSSGSAQVLADLFRSSSTYRRPSSKKLPEMLKLEGIPRVLKFVPPVITWSENIPSYNKIYPTIGRSIGLVAKDGDLINVNSLGMKSAIERYNDLDLSDPPLEIVEDLPQIVQFVPPIVKWRENIPSKNVYTKILKYTDSGEKEVEIIGDNNLKQSTIERNNVLNLSELPLNTLNRMSTADNQNIAIIPTVPLSKLTNFENKVSNNQDKFLIEYVENANSQNGIVVDGNKTVNDNKLAEDLMDNEQLGVAASKQTNLENSLLIQKNGEELQNTTGIQTSSIENKNSVSVRDGAAAISFDNNVLDETLSDKTSGFVVFDPIPDSISFRMKSETESDQLNINPKAQVEILENPGTDSLIKDKKTMIKILKSEDTVGSIQTARKLTFNGIPNKDHEASLNNTSENELAVKTALNASKNLQKLSESYPIEIIQTPINIHTEKMTVGDMSQVDSLKKAADAYYDKRGKEYLPTPLPAFLWIIGFN